MATRDPFAYLDEQLKQGQSTTPAAPTAAPTPPTAAPTPVASTPVPPTPPPGLAAQDPFGYLDSSTPTPAQGGAATPPTTAPAGDPRDIGFLRGAGKFLNPFPVIEGIRGLAVEERERSRAAGTMSGNFIPTGEDFEVMGNRLLAEAGFFKDVGVGMATGLWETGKEVYGDFAEGRISTGFGKAFGLGLPIGAAAGLRRIKGVSTAVPRTAKVANRKYNALRATLPTGSAADSQNALFALGRQAKAEVFSRWETARLSARQIAGRMYDPLDNVLNHPANVFPPGTSLRDPVRLSTRRNAKVHRKGIAAEAPVQAPIPTKPFVTELQAIIDYQRTTPLPAGHPIREFLEQINPYVKTGVNAKGKTVITDMAKKGFDYVRFMDMKKAIGELKVMLDSPGVGWGPEQYLARAIVQKVEQVLPDQLTTLAQRAGLDAAGVTDLLNSVAEADRAWASALRPFAKVRPSMAAMKEGFTEQRAMQGANFPYPKADPALTTISDAVGQAAPIARDAQRVGGYLKGALVREEESFLTFTTQNINHLRQYLRIAGATEAPKLLGQVLDLHVGTGNWAALKQLWSTNKVVWRELTAHDPALRQALPEVIHTLEQIEKVGGKSAVTSAIGFAAAKMGSAGRNHAVMALLGSWSTRMRGLSGILQNAASAKAFNAALKLVARSQFRHPIATSLATQAAYNAGGTALQVPTIVDRQKAKSDTKLAGE